MLKHNGFTLIELLFALVILSILACFAYPVGLSLFEKNQLQLREDELRMALHYARNNALSRNQSLALTPLPHSKDWSEGMILFIDNKVHQLNNADQLIYQWQWPHSQVKISWRGFISDQFLVFAPNLRHAALSGHFELQVGREKMIKLVVNRLGRIKNN